MPVGEIPASLAWAHPLVAEWFVGRFATPTEPQEQGWPQILAGRTTLISAPTGSGKTLAAFLICIDRLVRKALAGELRDATEVLYVSPLKALGNDIQKNLEAPLGEILALAGQRGFLMPEICTAVRTGDTLMKERREMLKRPPHILVTTPESLYILLTANSSRAILSHIRTVIVDEIHAVADDKRGAHLALSLERLALLADCPTRIGLSATQKPIEEVAHFLTGAGRPDPAIVNIGHRRQLDLAVEVPRSELGPVASNEMWGEIYDRIAELALQHRSTLVFVNTRRLAERVALHLGERMGEELVAAHHGSLARKLRLAAERKLKNGEIRALVATASLELGIDVGTVDLVCQINSPRSIAVALQRVGRAGHWRGAVSKGRLFVTTRDDLLECAATVRAVRQGDLDRLQIPLAPLDILAQQIVAMCSCEDWDEDGLFECVRRAYPYRELRREEYDRILEMLSLGIAARRGRYGAYLFRDMANRRLRARRGARLAAITSGGAIPETALFTVLARPEEIVVGTVDEDFAVESNAGDIMLLGNTSWRIHRVESNSGRLVVEDAHGAAPTIPFWRGEAPARTDELSLHVAELRECISARLPNTAPLPVAMNPEEAQVQRAFRPASSEGERVEWSFSSASSQPLFDSPPALAGTGEAQVFRRASGDTLFSAKPASAGGTGSGARVEKQIPRGLKAARDDNSKAGRNGAAEAVPVQTAAGRGPEGPLYQDAPRIRLRGLESSPEVQNAVAWLKQECGLDDAAAEQVIEYIIMGRAVLGEVPTQQTIIAERFFDEGGGMQLVIHAPFGGRINKAWGLALRKRFCRSFNFELQAAATDNGLNIALAEQHSFPLSDVFHYLQTETVQEILEQAALASPIFATRWRWDANRSLALLRFQGGKKVPPQIQRIRSDDLLASVFPDVAACQENIVGDIQIPDHPLVQEVMKDVLTEAMDIEGLRRVLEGIRSGTIRCLAVDTPVPSQFSHEILNANPYAYLDDAPLEERRARAVQMRRVLPEAVLNEIGKLDQQAIARVREEARPDVRDSDELHDTLQTLVALPEEIPDPDWQQAVESWTPFVGELLEGWRAVRGTVRAQTNPATQAKAAWVGHPQDLRRYYVASERAKDFALIFPEAQFEVTPPELPSNNTSRDDAVLAMVNGWMMHSGPITAGGLAYLLGLPAGDVEKALLRLEASGTILRGNFTGLAPQQVQKRDLLGTPTSVSANPELENVEWCERRLLARIHHLTVATLRKQVEPVTAARFMRWLLRWQHIAPQSQLSGERGLLAVIRQLQGFEIPANAWEKQILSRRVNDYDPAALDQLCLTGAVGWGRLSPHPATLEETSTPTRANPARVGGPGSADDRHPIATTTVAPGTPIRRRVVPTSVAPITFFVREESDWMQPRLSEDEQSYERVLSAGAHAVLEFLRRRGASFFADIVRGTGKLKAEIETALWELVAAGMVTADGFDNLRSLISPKRRLGPGSAKAPRPRHTPGRWSLLYPGEGTDRNKAVEATCWMLLRRYGVVFREVLARESNLPKWRELLIALRRLEDRGEVRGGRFVSGFLGEQFALPEAVESLRAMRNFPASGETITISAADPLNLVGFIVPGERVAAISGKYVSFRDGVAVEPEERASVLREAAR
ncbi:MAG TPA: DEAD/DEAH box helicase [Candidatus Binatia bacterium]|nr:DEAD/DEAH box helicase [Candidatus Binatia bacterium]